MRYLQALFIWWRDATLGTWLTTWLTGIPVGKDAYGNRYFRNKSDSRRWVIYNGTVEGSRVPALWHSWLHRTSDTPPANPEENGYIPNLSGTAQAYHPPGAFSPAGSAFRDYEPWSPS